MADCEDKSRMIHKWMINKTLRLDRVVPTDISTNSGWFATETPTVGNP
jgi:hypothetical protein